MMSRVRSPHIEITPRPAPDPVETSTPFSFVHINKCGGSSIEIALGLPKRHATAMALRSELGADAWASRFTFSVVRNPFDRIVSIYYYRLRRDYQGLADRHVSLNDWIAAVWRDGNARYNDWPLLNQPCTDWLVDAQGEMIVETVVRLEDISQAWPRISERLGITVPLPKRNTNARPAYRDVLTPDSRATVEKAFAEDLKRFDYDY